MRRFRFPVAVAITSLALVAAVAAIGALVVPSALASAPWVGVAARFGPHSFGGPGFELPPELQGLGDLPPDQRFSHFVGAQLSLKDKDGKPLTIGVVPGKVTAASDTSLTIAANDGTTRSYVLNEQTLVHGKPAQGGAQATLANGEQVVVVTLDNSATATAVAMVDGFGPGGHGGPWWSSGPFGASR
jgi:hypothetical protein